ncbi:MAG: amino acid ABC transporter ATP-binding protein [Pseudomonadota bacterium]|nr:amino acid ABC transporter ATP-binding protein [Pseudomonadota bacterium]
MSYDRVPVIRVNHVNKYFGDLHVLKNIHLTVEESEKLVICGPSGSGKSTIIRCLNGLETINSGELSVLHKTIKDPEVDWPRLRPKIGMLFQQFNLFPHLSILDNCTLAPRIVKGLPTKEAVELAYHFLDKVHIADQAEKYPIALSGGQQQRAAIARCLCMQPDIILFDEPTSALDPEMIQEVLDVMLGLVSSGITMICVTHEMEFARKFSDRVLFMDGGKIIEQAKPEVFFRSPESERAKKFLEQINLH